MVHDINNNAGINIHLKNQIKNLAPGFGTVKLNSEFESLLTEK